MEGAQPPVTVRSCTGRVRPMSTGLGRAVVPVRTLPIRLVPGVGEGLDSYLERLAQRSGAAWADILDAVGLDTGGARRDSRGLPMAVRPHPRAATQPQQRLRDRPNGVAPLDDGSTDPFGGGDVAGDHACSPAVSFAVAIALLPALSAADRRAVAVVVAAAVGVRLSASPMSAGRRLSRMRPLAEDKSLARRPDSGARVLCTHRRHLPWS